MSAANIIKLQRNPEKARIKALIPTVNCLEVVKVSDVVVVIATDNSCRIVMKDGKRIFATASFKSILNTIDQGKMIQIHKSHAVNLDFIQRYHKSGEVEMLFGLKYPVARRRKDGFLEQLAVFAR